MNVSGARVLPDWANMKAAKKRPRCDPPFMQVGGESGIGEALGKHGRSFESSVVRKLVFEEAKKEVKDEVKGGPPVNEKDSDKNLLNLGTMDVSTWASVKREQFEIMKGSVKEEVDSDGKGGIAVLIKHHPLGLGAGSVHVKEENF